MNQIRQKNGLSISRAIQQPAFAKLYVWISFCLLVLSTIYWAYLSSQIQLHNADQLNINNLDYYTLLKWPVILFAGIFHLPTISLTVISIFIALLTVGLFAAILYRIEHRPLRIGTIYLALSVLLLLIPAEAYPGALRSVNFAMIANHSLEYLAYLGSLILLIQTPRFMHWKNLVAIFVLCLLITSDVLFLYLSLGGALLAFVTYGLRRATSYRQLAIKWFMCTLAAAMLSYVGMWLLTARGIATITSSLATSPQAPIHNFNDLTSNISYAFVNILTNLGANPLYAPTTPHTLLTQISSQFLSLNTIPYLAIFMMVLGSIVLCIKIIAISLQHTPKHQPTSKQTFHPPEIATQLSILLIWTSIAALATFLLTTHSHTDDARPLTITLFAVVVTATTLLRRITLRPYVLISAGLLLVGLMVVSSLNLWQTFNRSLNTLAENDQRNSVVIANLSQHPVNTLVGNYQRVVPIKFNLPDQNIIPLSDCTTPRDKKDDKSWRGLLSHQSFSYLLTLDSDVSQSSCSIDMIILAYGRPNSIQVITGNIQHPTEVLLYYDNGITSRLIKQKNPTSNILHPREISALSGSHCDGITIMNIVAHQDDDILFMNPDLVNSIHKGNCIRSVYVTAGDAGSNKLYWLSREEGSKAAYATMLGIKDPVWFTETVNLSQTSYISIARIKGMPKVSLIFMHLPDGNIDGNGFTANKQESLVKLKTAKLSVLHSVDKQSRYTSDELITALAKLMLTYTPDEVHTQALVSMGKKYVDHPDHLAVGWYASRAYQQYKDQSPASNIKFYIGYPVRELPENVTGSDLQASEAAFFAYSRHDKGYCESETVCSEMSYISYLKRQYLQDEPTP